MRPSDEIDQLEFDRFGNILNQKQFLGIDADQRAFFRQLFDHTAVHKLGQVTKENFERLIEKNLGSAPIVHLTLLEYYCSNEDEIAVADNEGDFVNSAAALDPTASKEKQANLKIFKTNKTESLREVQYDPKGPTSQINLLTNV